jgi:hypothetical protein
VAFIDSLAWWRAPPLAYKIACEQSLRGHEDFPRHYPRIFRKMRVGSADMSRLGRGGSLHLGASFVAYPTRNFARDLPQRCAESMTSLAKSSLHVAMQSGPSLHPNTQMSDVWPLRIPFAFPRSVFPADCPHRMRCHCLRSSTGYSEIPANSRISLRQRSTLGPL